MHDQVISEIHGEFGFAIVSSRAAVLTGSPGTVRFLRFSGPAPP